MKRELLRQAIHLVYGVVLALVCVQNAWIGVALSALFVIGSIAHRVQEIPIIEGVVRRLERTDDPLPGFGSITLTIGITSVALVFPEHGLIAGLGIAIIDSIATAIGVLGGGKRKKLAASFVGGAVFFIVITSAFSDVSVLRLAYAALAGTIVEFLTSSKMILDDNVTVPWAIAVVLALF